MPELTYTESPEYTAARQAYWDAQSAFRQTAVAELVRLMPDDVVAFTFAMNDDIDVQCLRSRGWIGRDGDDYDPEDHELYMENGGGLFDLVDQIAIDMEVASWEDASNFLLRHPDRQRFILERPTPGKDNE
jgi:hypothetical protein